MAQPDHQRGKYQRIEHRLACRLRIHTLVAAQQMIFGGEGFGQGRLGRVDDGEAVGVGAVTAKQGPNPVGRPDQGDPRHAVADRTDRALDNARILALGQNDPLWIRPRGGDKIIECAHIFLLSGVAAGGRCRRHAADMPQSGRGRSHAPHSRSLWNIQSWSGWFWNRHFRIGPAMTFR